MPEQTIICPHCHQPIPLSQALKAQLDEELAAKTKTLQADVQQQFQARLEAEKQKLWLVAQTKAREKLDTEMKDLQEQFSEKSQLLAKAQESELALRKQKRELEERQQQLDLELQRKLDEERGKIAAEAKQAESEVYRLKLLEKDKQAEIMKKTIEDLRRQSEQGSMQIQGEVQENDLKDNLGTQFPGDTVQDVPTGVRGADLIQTVNTVQGEKAGIILWESKNTKKWSADWVSKLKDDQTATKAEIAIIVTRALPLGTTEFSQVNGIWVVQPEQALALAAALRLQLLELYKVRRSLVGRDQKMEVLYNYLSGTQFRNRVETIVTAFSQQQIDLQAERRAMEKIWRKRSQELERVIENTAGFYGDLQGIMGASLANIQSLELPTGEEGDHDH
jgi:hypothetical protein